jgi:ribosome-associated translation inhibitor RaiA
MGAAGRSIKRAPFAATVSRAERREAGRTWAPKTPLAVRTSGLAVDPELRRRIHDRLGLRLGKFAPRIERLTVRFEDVNGPRGGKDVACRIKVVISGLPSVVVTELARKPVEAFDRVGQRLERVVRGAIGRGREHGRLDRMPPPGKGHQGMDQPKARGANAPRATASTADRNRQGRARKATVALEGSTLSRPSRKSTRGSANRAKHGNKLARRERRRASSPNARRAQAAKTH